MSKRKVKEAQKVQQYKIGDTLQINGMDYRVVEVLPDGYHVKNISSPFNSFIYAQGLDGIQGISQGVDELPQFQTPEELDELEPPDDTELLSATTALGGMLVPVSVSCLLVTFLLLAANTPLEPLGSLDPSLLPLIEPIPPPP